MQYFQWLIKGLAMGAADVVPGVSGGTLAFILGVYHRLLSAITAVNITALRLLGRGQFRALWQQIDGTFLLCLFSGVLCSVFSLAGLVSWLLVHRPVPLWALFNGLMLASLPVLFRGIRWNPRRLVLFGLGVAFAVWLGRLTPTELTPSLWMYFISGAIAICAMILPGTSGSFMLLLMGMYAPVLLAVSQLKMVVLLVFMAGCICGLLSFSRLLKWLLQHHHDTCMALLTGIIMGGFYRIWPWQAPQQLYLPSGYAANVGPADVGLAAACLLGGILIMFVLLNLEKWFTLAATAKSAPTQD